MPVRRRCLCCEFSRKAAVITLVSLSLLWAWCWALGTGALDPVLLLSSQASGLGREFLVPGGGCPFPHLGLGLGGSEEASMRQ